MSFLGGLEAEQCDNYARASIPPSPFNKFLIPAILATSSFKLVEELVCAAPLISIKHVGKSTSPGGATVVRRLLFEIELRLLEGKERLLGVELRLLEVKVR